MSQIRSCLTALLFLIFSVTANTLHSQCKFYKSVVVFAIGFVILVLQGILEFLELVWMLLLLLWRLSLLPDLQQNDPMGDCTGIFTGVLDICRVLCCCDLDFGS